VAERTAPRAARASPASASNGAERDARAATRRTRSKRGPASKSRRTADASKPQARIIAVANQKGGVGKSTTAVSLGAALAELGKRVLVVDLDPQGNASTGLGIRHEAREVTVYDVLAAEASIEGAIVQTPVENLFAIPSTIDLAGAEIELVSQFSRELRLRKAIEPLKDGAYDFILLDCPPSLGLLTVNALAAAEELIVPIQCEYYALEGLGQLLRNVRLVQQNVNQGLRLTGIVMTMYDPRTKLSEQVVQEVRRYFGDRVYRTIIPRTVRLSEAPGFGQPITVYDPRSKGAQCYRDLAQEVAAKLPEEGPLPVIDDLPTVITPPPEPEPARAPRPLVGPEEGLEEDLEADLEARMEELVDQPVEADVPLTEVRGEADDNLEPGVGETEAQVHAAAGASGTDAQQETPVPEPEVETGMDGSTSRPAPSAKPEPGPTTEAEPPGEAERLEPAPPAEPSGGAPHEIAPGVEVGRVVVIDERREVDVRSPGAAPQPAEEAEAGAEPEVEADRKTEPEDVPKRRWSLFRRGGDR
jgi:chromosome partitioning protein